MAVGLRTSRRDAGPVRWPTSGRCCRTESLPGCCCLASGSRAGSTSVVVSAEVAVVFTEIDGVVQVGESRVAGDFRPAVRGESRVLRVHDVAGRLRVRPSRSRCLACPPLETLVTANGDACTALIRNAAGAGDDGVAPAVSPVEAMNTGADPSIRHSSAASKTPCGPV